MEADGHQRRWEPESSQNQKENERLSRKLRVWGRRFPCCRQNFTCSLKKEVRVEILWMVCSEQVSRKSFFLRETTLANKMLFLLLPLLAALLPSGDSKAGFEDPISFYVLQTLSFYNRSWVQNLGSGWLSDLETHRWQNDSDVIALLRPWSRGNFSNKELLEIETIFHMHYIRVIREIHSVARNLQLECRFSSLPGAWGNEWLDVSK
nr:T-cell surface glycoprotein CD1a [Oryctolagus cuniculus]